MSRCAVCGGDKKEHGPGLTQHQYTETPGDLKPHPTPEEQARAGDKTHGTTQLTPPKGLAEEVAHAREQIKRLVDVMLHRGGMAADEALYVFGLGDRPKRYHEGEEPRLF